MLEKLKNKGLFPLLAAGAAVIVFLILLLACVTPVRKEANRLQDLCAAAEPEKAGTAEGKPEYQTLIPPAAPKGGYTGYIIRTYKDKEKIPLKEETYDRDGNLLREPKSDSYGTFIYEYSYDGEGRKIREDRFDETGTELQRTQITAYDANGNKTDEVTFDYTDGEPVVDKWINSRFDEHGEMIRQTTTEKHGTTTDVTDVTVTYDDAGRLVKRVSKNEDLSDNHSTTTETFKYDAAGNLIEEATSYSGVFLDERESWSSKDVYEYNEAGQKTRDKSFWKGKLSDITDFFYWENGKLKTRYVYEPDGTTLTHTWHYDEDGEILEEGKEITEEFDSEGRLAHRKVTEGTGDWMDWTDTDYFYDENGLLIRTESVRHWHAADNDVLSRAEYEYLY